MTADDALKHGGPWWADHHAVTADGYREDWGAQQSTADNGPTVDGLARGDRTGGGPVGRGGGLINIREGR